MKFPPFFALLLALLTGSISALAISAPTILDASVSLNDGAGKLFLNATVKPNEGLTKVKFSYGQEGSSKYEATTEEKIVTGDSDPDGVGSKVSTQITGLIGGKKYRFKVIATNAAGAVSSTEFNFTDAIHAYQPAITAEAARVTSGTEAIVGATLTGNGSENYTVDFVYGLSEAALDQIVSGGAVEKDAVGQKIVVTLGNMETTGKPPLTRETTYFYRIVLKLNGVPADTLPHAGQVPGNATAFTFKTTNHAPVTKDITLVLLNLSPVVVDVLKNNKTDQDGDTIRLAAIALAPSHGTAVVRGKTILYTPGADFIGTDLFSYSVEDGREGVSVGNVIVRSARAAVKGRQSAFITDSSGKNVGMVRLQVGVNGAFSGKVEIKGKSYQVVGEFDAEGRFHGRAEGEDGTLEISFGVAVAGDGSTLTGSFGGGQWSASSSLTPISAEKQVELAGRYTLELPAGSVATPITTEVGVDVTDTPATTTAAAGWAVIKLNESGEARIKGKTSDGESFSTRAVLGGTSEAPTLNFYAVRDRDELSSVLMLGETVTGSVVVSGHGDDQTIAVDGAPYHPPQDRGRVLETAENEGKLGTITITGPDGGPVTHALRFSKENKIEVLDANGDGLSLKVDKDSLKFIGKIRPSDFSDDREKISGVFIQSKGTGRGQAHGDDGVRRVEIMLTPTRASTTP
ncbi:MAG: thrombospondin [Chthoniobacteraceae bacterium]|nr:thrombospondin [Chthoniobacteraceae bacterium]